MEKGNEVETRYRSSGSEDMAEFQRASIVSNDTSTEFEEGKQKILSSLPTDLKHDFRKVCFTKWEEKYYSIMQLSPYDVSPGQVRDEWMQMYHKRNKAGKPFCRLVYWYGSDIGEAFSLIPATRIISYENGLEKGVDKIPSDIERKLRNGRRLTTKEKVLINGHEEAKKDLCLLPLERSPWLFDFKEEHEKDLDYSDCYSSIESRVKGSFKRQKGNLKKESDVVNGSNIQHKENDDSDDSDKEVLSCSPSHQNNTCINSIPPDSVGASKNLRKRERSSFCNEIGKDKKINLNENEGQEQDSGNEIDVHVSVKPLPPKSIDNSDGGHKRYSLKILQNGKVKTDSELHFVGNDTVTKKLKDKRITLNLVFKI